MYSESMPHNESTANIELSPVSSLRSRHRLPFARTAKWAKFVAVFALLGGFSGSAKAQELWTMVGSGEGNGRTLAKINLSNPADPLAVVYGVGIKDPAHPTDDPTTINDWTTVAVTPSRTLYFIRRSKTDVHDVNIYSAPADGITVDPNYNGTGAAIVTNLTALGMITTAPGTLGTGDTGTVLSGNWDGLCAGPDGNIYMTSYEAINFLTGQDLPKPFVNGLWRYKTSGTNLSRLEYVGSFAGQAFDPNAPFGVGNRNIFYTDLAFDPLNGDLVGNGIDANGHQTLYRIDANTALTSVNNQALSWHWFGGDSSNWATIDLANPGFTGGRLWQDPDGVAFDPTDLNTVYLTGDGQGVAVYNRTGVGVGPSSLGPVGYLGTPPVPHLPASLALFGFGYDLAAIPPLLGSISGTLYCDHSGNNMFDASEGINGITVSLQDGVGHVLAATVTSGDGGYKFSNLAVGTYVVIAPPTAGGCKLNSTSPLTVNLAAGENRMHVDFQYVPGSISGLVYCDENSNGVFDNGDVKLAGSTVTLTLGNAVVGIFVTQSNGLYSFTGLMAGTYTVSVSPPTLGGCNLATTPITVILPPGGNSGGHDFRYVPPPTTGNGATRTWGFYKTHLDFFKKVVASGAVNLGILTVTQAQMPPAGGTENLISPSINILEGIFYTPPGAGGSALAQARLSLAHQLIAALGNANYIGTSTASKRFSPTLLSQAVAALDGTNTALMNSLEGQLDSFNNSGDPIGLPNGLTEGKADPKGAAALAIDPGPAFH